MTYGRCLLQIMHFFLALQLLFPDTNHHQEVQFSRHIQKTYPFYNIGRNNNTVVWTEILQLYFNSFKGSSNLSAWCGLGEMMCDLWNERRLMEDLDPDGIFSPTQPIIPELQYMYLAIPFAVNITKVVEVPTTFPGRGDCYLDNIIKVYVGI